MYKLKRDIKRLYFSGPSEVYFNDPANAQINLYIGASNGLKDMDLKY